MSPSRIRHLANVTTIAALILLASPITAETATPAPAPAPSVERLSLDLRGVHFVPNRGQWADETVFYGFKSRGLDVAFRESGLTMHLRGDDPTSRDREGAVSLGAPPRKPLPDGRGSFDPLPQPESLTLTVTFPGSNPVAPAAADARETTFNYYLGDDESRWQAGVPSFGRVVYDNLYDGIDLHVMGSDDGVLKYEFHCEPGANHEQIRIHYDGIDGLCVDDNGGLLIETALGTLRDQAPVAWQERGGRRQHVPAQFEMMSAPTYAISLVTAPDPTLPLVIDPEIEWMTFLGGSGGDYGFGLAIGDTGDIFIAGLTTSIDFEGRTNGLNGGPYDAFVAGVSADGRLRWMTYAGGNGDDRGDGLIVDRNGDLLVTGSTWSENLPARTNELAGVSDLYVMRLTEAGEIVQSTYVGGTGEDFRCFAAVIDDEAIVIVGGTGSHDLPGRTNQHHGGGRDAFAARMSRSGAIEWTTYLGGSSGDSIAGVAVDQEGAIRVVGETTSPNFEGRINQKHGQRDSYVARVDSSGSIEWVRFLGGSAIDNCGNVAVDSGGNAFVTGSTRSGDFEGKINHRQRASFYRTYLVKVNPSGGLEWMLYLGGSSEDTGHDVAMLEDDMVVVTGWSGSRDFIGHINTHWGGAVFEGDAYALKVTTNGMLQSMVYLGGSHGDGGNAIAVDQSGRVIVAGATNSRDFVGHTNELHGDGDEDDAFVLRVELPDGPSLGVAVRCPDDGNMTVTWAGMPPGGPVSLFAAQSPGSVTIPDGFPCQGVRLDLNRRTLRHIRHGFSGNDGSGRFFIHVVPEACGSYLQMIDRSSCTVSNVARVE